jgi:hypothetical protein
MIGSNDYPPEPPSEIRQDRSPVRGGELAEERRRNGIIRAEPLFHIDFLELLRENWMYKGHGYFVLKRKNQELHTGG